VPLTNLVSPTRRAAPMAGISLNAALSMAACLWCGTTMAWAEVPSAPGFELQRPHHMLGSASCAASNCHGGPSIAGSDPAFSAHRTWLKHDPHARAFAVLSDPRSMRIIDRLRASGNWNDATNETRCLTCHAHVASAQQPHAKTFQVSDGVSCEVCHGPAEHWLAAHSRPEAWADQDQRATGFRPLGDFADRAEVCLDCHLGGPNREVNHDLIAAGHPRLAFELAAYSALQPRHWSIRRDAARAAGSDDAARSDVDAELWMTGQLVAARRGLELTKHRAERAERAATQAPDQPWPELTEYGCFACHHDLRAPEQPTGYLVRRFATGGAQPPWDHDPPGSLVWQPWLLALAPELPTVDANWRQELKLLREQIRSPYPATGVVIARCDVALNMTRDFSRASNQLDPPDLRPLLIGLLERRERTTRTWEGATQTYLALVALTRSPASDGASSREIVHRKEVDAALRRMRQALSFPAGHDGPAMDYGRVHDIEQALETLRELSTDKR
jgi:hypothetical protein